MYFDSAAAEAIPQRPYLAVATACAVAATIVLGLLPEPILARAAEAMTGVLLGPP
jgi:hypothetical protein